jgi:BirA family transcriptional regulator, biotin operon repressor / biotin---[acetyl-CoA-carboxylase] ligase
MTDASAWARAGDPRRRIGHSVEHHAQIGSTNDRARELIGERGGEGRAVVADLQTAGRGRRGRTWESPPGVNLMVSVGIRPRIAPRDAGLLGLAAALATRDACASCVPHPLAIRWPNDVVDGEGRKIAGLLLETTLEEDRLTGAVIGVGINVNWLRDQMPAEIAERATSLADLAGEPIDRIRLLDALLDTLDAEVAALEGGRSPVPRIRNVSALDGRWVEVELGDARLEGTAIGIEEDGSLRLHTGGREMALTSGEVVAVRAADSPAEPTMAWTHS